MQSSSSTSNHLKRQLGFWDSVAINVGIVIGVGIFRTPAEIAKILDSGPWILLAWVLGGVVSLLGVMCYAELSSCSPHSGGNYIYLRDAYGRGVGFLYGWIEFTILRAGSTAGVAYVFTDYLHHFIPFAPWAYKVIAISVILIFTSINIMGIHFGRGIQNVLSSMKVLTLLGMTGVIFFLVFSGKIQAANAGPFQFEMGKFVLLAPALIPVLWTYGGWHESTFMSGEFKDTRWALPLSLLVSCFIITALYVMMNAAYLAVLTPGEMMHSQAIAAEIFQRLFGQTGHIILTTAVIISACGALNSYTLTGARIPYAVGGDIAKLNWLGKVHGKLDTPARAFMVNAIWASLLALWGNFEQIVFFCGFAKWLVFAMVGVSVFILRQRFHAHDGFKLMGYPWVPSLFIVCSLILCGATIYHSPREALFGALLILSGIPIYLFLKRPAAIKSS